jgi:hypothetical protein
MRISNAHDDLINGEQPFPDDLLVVLGTCDDVLFHHNYCAVFNSAVEVSGELAVLPPHHTSL